MAFAKLKEAVQRRTEHYFLGHDILYSDLTLQAQISLMGSPQLLKKAEIIMREHNLMKVEKLEGEAVIGNQQQCILASQLGGQIFHESIMGMSYLSPTERLLMLEFMERFDRGDYPQFVREEDRDRQQPHETVHGHTTGLTD